MVKRGHSGGRRRRLSLERGWGARLTARFLRALGRSLVDIGLDRGRLATWFWIIAGVLIAFGPSALITVTICHWIHLPGAYKWGFAALIYFAAYRVICALSRIYYQRHEANENNRRTTPLHNQ